MKQVKINLNQEELRAVYYNLCKGLYDEIGNPISKEKSEFINILVEKFNSENFKW